MNPALERALLVGVATGHVRPKEARSHLEELQRLAETAGADVVATVLQRLPSLHPATLVGEGKLQEIQATCSSEGIGVVVFDTDLTGSQARNLEGRLPGIKVIDRSALILDIFARHARTAESRTMVEIAQLQYTLPRLTGAWTHLCRQVGGIGTRGPGETQLEVDRRAIRRRIRDLKEKLSRIETSRAIQRENRGDVFHIAVVGYTNAGKSTLTNRLTSAGVLVEDKLFATLDSTTRRLHLRDGNSAVLSDTVGFIRKLPHHLVASFRTTLAVAGEADLLVEVVDASDPVFMEHMQVTSQVLADLVDPATPRLTVFNKCELLDPMDHERLSMQYPMAILASAKDGIGLELLKNGILAEYQQWMDSRCRSTAEPEFSESSDIRSVTA